MGDSFLHTVPPAAGSTLADRGEPARRALLAAGAQVFGEKGLAAATTREIAAKAGQNIAAIKYYFEGKEGLYLAIARAIGDAVGARVSPIRAALAQRTAPPTPREAMDLIEQLVTAMTHTMMGEELPAIAQFIVREQQHPTPAFDLIYAGISAILETLTALLAIAFDLRPRATDTTLRAHALLGQILGFRVARETLLRRTGWTGVGPREAEAVLAAILAGLESMFAGHVATRRARPRTRSRTVQKESRR